MSLDTGMRGNCEGLHHATFITVDSGGKRRVHRDVANRVYDVGHHLHGHQERERADRHPHRQRNRTD